MKIRAEVPQMACLAITTAQLEHEFNHVWADGQDVPKKLWLDHYHTDTTFIRAVFPKKFGPAAADKLIELRGRLQSLYGGETDVGIVVFLRDHPWKFFERHARQIEQA